MPDSTPATASRAVFLSHAHQDSDVVQRIANALENAGVEVWFDRKELVGGDAWDAKIRRQIAECALLIPVISANTQARLEGYFRIEWKLAAQRTHAMAEEKPFLLPVVIDETRDSEARVPGEFRAVQWTRLPGGEVTAMFVERVRRLLDHGPEVGVGAGAARAAPGIGRAGAGFAPKTTARRFPAWAFAALGVAALVAFVALRPPGKEKPASRPPWNGPKSIAVLPFENRSTEKENEFFTDGVHDEILSQLSRIRELHVTSRTSVKQYRDTKKTVKQIGEELGVAYILEGSVQRAGNKVSVTGQLIRTGTDGHLWAQNYVRDLTDIFALQADLAKAIASELNATISPQEKLRIERRPTANLDAYDFYLRGKPYFGTDREATDRSIVMLRKAIALDGNFAEAHAVLALAYGNLAYFLDAANKQWETLADAAMARALELNTELPEAHLALSRFYFRPSNGFQLEKAMAESRRALGIRPNLSEAHSMLGSICFHTGLVEQSRKHYQKAADIDPGGGTARFDLAVIELYQGRYDAALGGMAKYRKSKVDSMGEYRVVSALIYTGRRKDAADRLAEVFNRFQQENLKDGGGLLTAMQALLLAVDGEKDGAVKKISEAQESGERLRPFSPHPACDRLGVFTPRRSRSGDQIPASGGGERLSEHHLVQARSAPRQFTQGSALRSTHGRITAALRAAQGAGGSSARRGQVAEGSRMAAERLELTDEEFSERDNPASASQPAQKVERAIDLPGQGFVREVGVDHDVLLRGDFVVRGKLRTRRADVVHEPGEQQDLRLDAGGEKLDVDIAELREDFLLAFMPRIEGTEKQPQFLVGVRGVVHFPDALVVAQEREDGCGPPDARLECGAHQGQRPALGGAEAANARGVDFDKIHHDARKLHRIEKQLTEHQPGRIRVVESAHDVSAERGPLHPGVVLGPATLAAAVHRGVAKALGRPAEFVEPVAGVPGITMKLQHGGMLCPGGRLRSEVLGVDSGAADPGEPEIKALDLAGVHDRGRAQLRAWIRRVKLAKRRDPVGGVVRGARVASAVGVEFGQRQVDEGHFREAERIVGLA